MVNEPIAIVGVGCRFPGGADDHKEFWNLLLEGRDAIVDIPADRWDKDALFNHDYTKLGKLNVKQGGFIKDIDQFDAQFFGISPVEANRVDPLQRLVLETTYQALEDAGLRLKDLAGTATGVFIGNSSADYMEMIHGYKERVNIGPTSNTGVSAAIIANRVSYIFDLLGPSFSLDTACSSSLVALHQACRSIWASESKMAVVGGVNLILKPEWHMGFSKGGYLSPDCRCKAFDKKANGYVRAEGVGIVILKPLSKALIDRDRIYAQIIGSAINEDGKTQGITVPNQEAQINMLKQAYKNAGIDPAEVQYVEAHGTGTQAGDFREANAIGSVIGKSKKSGNFVYIGSVKTNIGHLEPASGMAGLIKLVLSMKHRKIPKNLHFKEGNPKIKFKENKIKVPQKLVNWPNSRKTLYAGINSFGFGGANAHAVLKEAPETTASKKKETKDIPSIFVISARNIPALKALANKYIKYLGGVKEDLSDICYSLLTRRTMLENRLSMVVKSKREVIKCLKKYIKGEASKSISIGKLESERKKIAFVFSGQGPQWWGMGRSLLKKNKLFKNKIVEIDEILKELGWLKESNSTLIQELLKSENDSRMNETAIAQPAIFAIQVALYELWVSLGVQPEAVIGHSIGEVAAGYASGSLSLKDATRVVYWRSKCQSTLEGKGKMLAVEAKEEDLYIELNDNISVAAKNGPKTITLSGNKKDLDKLSKILTKRNVYNTFLRVNVPFHSYLTESIKESFLHSLRKVNTRQNIITLFSTVTGEKISGLKLDSVYWYQNIRQTVEFYPAIQRMIQDGYNTFVELSPHPVLAMGINDTLDEKGKNGVSLPSLRRKEDEEVVFFDTLSKLIISDCEINLKQLLGENNKYVDLPYYAWQKERYWLETEESKNERLGSYIHPHLTGYRRFIKERNDIIWEGQLNKLTEPYIDDHRVQGSMVYPAAGHIDLVATAAKLSFGNDFNFIEDVRFETAMLLSEDVANEIQLEISSDNGNYTLYSRFKNSGSEWKKCSYGKINHCQDKFIYECIDIKKIKRKITKDTMLRKKELYESLSEDGVYLGESFRVVERCYYNQNELLTEMKVSDEIISNYKKFSFHPAMLDGCIHSAIIVFQNFITKDDAVFLPTHLDKMKINFDAPISDNICCYVRINSCSRENVCFDFWIFNKNNELMAVIKNLVFSSIEGTRKSERKLDDYFYNYRWHLKNIEKPKKYDFSGGWLVLQNNTSICNKVKTLLTNSDNDCLFLNNISEITNHKLNNVEKIIYLCGLDESINIGVNELEKKQSNAGSDLIGLMKKISDSNTTSYIYVVTNGVEQIKEQSEKMSPISAPIWGLVRVIMNEYPHLSIKLIDLSFSPGSGELKRLVEEISIIGGEEVALRRKDRYVHVLEKSNPKKMLEDSRKMVSALGYAYNAVVGVRKSIDKIYLREFTRKDPQDDEVEVKVYASALNFRDVMVAMGMLSDEAVSGGLYDDNLGLECSGKITKTGCNVDDFKVGDEVIALSPKCLGGFAYAKKWHIALKPEHFTHEEASTIMIVYLTAYYSLHYLCRMTKSDKILIHAGAGGVGIAAIKLAQFMGAEVFATAGSEQKRRYLESLGVKYIMDSRSLSFKNEVMELTEGKGVDIVINSIAGKAITQSISCLAPYGRFVEIGKIDIYDDKRIGLKPFGNNLSYFAVDIDRLLKQKPMLSEQMITGFMELFYDKKLDAHPYKKFPISKIKDAFMFLSQSKHMGKVVISMKKEKEIEVYPPVEIRFKKDAAYLVTGGCGGFGLGIAAEMVEKGAGFLVLMGRSGVKGTKEKKIIDGMRKSGTQIIIAKGDVTKEKDIVNIVLDLRKKNINLKGVIHAATVFDDAPITELNKERYMSVVRPKVKGAWNLHRATLKENLDYFVMFSSISSIYGNPAQANYAAGNAFLDSFAYYRRSLGLPANTINWGVIKEVGFASRNKKVQNILRSQGWIGFDMQQAGKILERIILNNPVQQIAINVDWKKVEEFFPQNKNSERFGSLVKKDSEESGNFSKNKEELRCKLLGLEKKEQIKLLLQELRMAIARILGANFEKVDAEVPITNMGLDSLMATQLRSWIQTNLKIDYSIINIMQSSSIICMVEQLLNEIHKNTNVRNLEKENGKYTIATKNDEFNKTEESFLKSDCYLDETIRPTNAYNPNGKIKNIFITGSTGFLGAFLVKDLMENTDCNLYCLVRASTETEGIKRITENMEYYKCWNIAYIKRIIPVLGDFSKPLLGISKDYFEKLSFKIDSIYHAGVLANFVYSYNELRIPNVLSVIEALRLACMNKTKPFHYVSSLSVFFNPSHSNDKIAYEGDTLESGNGYFFGYITSKWVGEKIVRIAEQRGLPVSIYRPGEITGASDTGIWKMSDMISYCIVSAIQTGIVPNVASKIYITPVDYVSKAITHLSLQKNSLGKAFHLVNNNIKTLTALIDIISDFGYDVKLVSFKKWKKKIGALSNTDKSEALKSLEVLLVEEQMDRPELRLSYDISNVSRGLKGTSISCPAVSKDLIFKYLKNFIANKYIPDFLLNKRKH